MVISFYLKERSENCTRAVCPWVSFIISKITHPNNVWNRLIKLLSRKNFAPSFTVTERGDLLLFRKPNIKLKFSEVQGR